MWNKIYQSLRRHHFLSPRYFACTVAACIALQPANAADGYANTQYGYGMRCSQGEYHQTAAPAPNHGFVLRLASGAQIWVDAAYDAALWGSVDAAIHALREELAIPATAKTEKTHIGSLSARRLAWSQGNRWQVRMIAWRPRGNALPIIYTFALDAPHGTSAQDRRAFEQCVGSFRLHPVAR